ncbi:MAG: DUF2252 domain-containing protein, partial [Thermoplasmata archaeon]|nr:DUF2252 domain-containing protein [Thermoplasmata archaeon]
MSQKGRPRKEPAQDPGERGPLRRIYSDLAARSRYDFLTPAPPWEARHERGRRLRAGTARSAHAWWKAASDRPDVVTLIERSNVGRVADLVPIRMGRMAASRFGFLRGSAVVMAPDLSRTPSSGIHVLLDGDAHLGNFGLFGTVERDVVFDLNDFDEAIVGPFEWDLKRLVASVEVAGRELDLAKKVRRRAVRAAVAGYRRELLRLERMGALDVWYLFLFAGRRNADPRLDPTTLKVLRAASVRAGLRTNATLLNEVAERRPDGSWRLRIVPPLQARVSSATRTRVVEALAEYGESLPRERRYLLSRYHVVDVARRVVGVGSVGTRDFIVLLFGNGEGDPLFLQVKEATTPAAEPFAPPLPTEFRDHPGRRVVTAQRGLNGSPDILLGWTRVEGRPFYVRQLRNMKGAVPLDHLGPATYCNYVAACGAILARAHARSGDAALLAGYCGTSDALDRALVRFAERYADQTEKDHATLVRAISDGRVR